MSNTTPKTSPQASFEATGCMAHLLVLPRLINSDDYDFLFVRGNDGRVVRSHVNIVCNDCVLKIVRYMENE
jgi:hypothetical protein